MKYTRYMVLILISFMLLPFLTILMPSKIKDYFFNELGLQLVDKKITNECLSDSSRVMAIYQFVTTNIETPQKSLVPKQIYPFEILIEGVGYCDQQSNVLISLAEKNNMKGNLIFLRGFDHESRHSVCEVFFNGGYRMFDPLYRRTFQNADKNLASIREIQDSAIHYPNDLNGLPDFYFRLFEKTYPYIVCKSNELPIHRLLLAKIISAWIFCFDDFLLKTYINLYIGTSDKYQSKGDRIRALLADKSIGS